MKIYDGGIIREMTEEEEKEILNAEIPAGLEIQELKRRLDDTDYQAIKYAEGWLSEEEYADVKAVRQKWRDRINELETEGQE